MIFKKLDNIVIRPMVLSDLSSVKVVRDQCLDFIHDSKSYSLDETIKWYLDTLPHYLSVLQDTELIGYFRLTDITSNSCFVGMDLHQDHRGKGIALNTYNAVMTELKKYGICNFSLYVLSNNEHAIRLYNHIGFKEIESAPWNISEAEIIYNVSMTTMEI
jgi:ribosomal protein S18 acetylase RimI-like enzyme